MTRRWLGALSLAVLFAVACFFLGRWQWHRFEVKNHQAQRISRNYNASPIPLGDVLPQQSATLPPSREWTPVTVTGTYDAAHQLLVRNRPFQGDYGYEVVVPLQTLHGGTLLVDRGWVPNARTASDHPEVPPPPRGPVTVTGWLRQGEPSLGRTMLPGQLASINVDEADRQIGRPTYRTYVILKIEQTGANIPIARPQALEAPEVDKGPHLAYAIQWWAVMLVGFPLVFVGARREAQAGADAEVLVRGGVPRAVKPRKVRIWDEEDE